MSKQDTAARREYVMMPQELEILEWLEKVSKAEQRLWLQSTLDPQLCVIKRNRGTNYDLL
jgi:hypothetical protein